MKLALIQLKQTTDPAENIERAFSRIREAKDADIIVLPESFIAPFGTERLENCDNVLGELRLLAEDIDAFLVAGTLPEETDQGFYNTCYVFTPDGREYKYRKNHLFDVDFQDLHTRESERYRSGDEITTFETPWGTVGLAVCYDLRFPKLFTDLTDRGAEVIIVPAAFSKKTGELHWELINRARALDSQCFIASCAPAQDEERMFPVYGHSMIVSPNGEVLDALDGNDGILYADIDLSQIEVCRQSLPVTRTRQERGE